MATVVLLLCSVLSLAAQESKRAKIVFDKESHTFGKVLRSGGDVSVEFRYTNEGDAPLVVKKATTSCQCTSVEFSKKPVMPGKSGVIKVIYSPHKLPAESFHKAIKVFTNDAQGMHILTIHGESID